MVEEWEYEPNATAMANRRNELMNSTNVINVSSQIANDIPSIKRYIVDSIIYYEEFTKALVAHRKATTVIRQTRAERDKYKKELIVLDYSKRSRMIPPGTISVSPDWLEVR